MSPDPEADAVGAWAASGAMSLTGRADGPALGPPAPLVDRVRSLERTIADRTAVLGRRVEPDGLALLGERAAIAGLHRQGTTSNGGATRLLEAADGWVALSLARADDVDLVPALVAADHVGGVWQAIAESVRGREEQEVVELGILLGLPIAALGEAAPEVGVARTLLGDAPARTDLAGVVVADLSSLWAGPLCGAVLADAGADVVKIESTGRPDGARSGPRPFFDLLNGGKRSVAVDLSAASGRSLLHRVVAAADVVIEASRPRALRQLGIDADELVASGPQVWVSITGHGRDGPNGRRVAFGDDAAAAGGLVCWDGTTPSFCADAVADPLTGLTAVAAVLDALAEGGRSIIDVRLAGVAASCAGPTLPVREGVVAAPARARQAATPARTLGADTAAVLGRLGGRR